MIRKILLITAALCLAAGGLFPAPVTAAQPMRVVYGFDREFPPFSYEDPGGKPVGFEVEILEAIFKNSATLVIRPMQWNMIPVELASGNITITSGMVKTEERSKLFLFPDAATFTLQFRLFTKIYNRFPNATFLRGQRVSVEEGSYQHHLLQAFGGMNIKTFKDRISPIKALFNDEVEAYCGPVQNAYYYMEKLNFTGITTLGTPLGITELRYAVNRDRGDILRMLNEGLRRIRENGEYDRIYRKWFVRDLTADETAELLKTAKEGLLTAYTPYSGKTRGAALLTATGRTHKGSPVENADPRLNIPALSAALAGAVAAADLEIRAAMVVDAKGAVQPMSADELQLLHEFGRGILVMDPKRQGEPAMVGELLPKPVIVRVGPQGPQ